MVMQSMRRGTFAGVFKIFFMGLLVLATGGLVLTDVGGFFRGGVSGNDVAKVGGQTIPITRFHQTVQRTLPNLGISTQEAYQLGYLRQLLNGEIRTHLMQQAARNSGIEVSRAYIARQVNDIVAPFVQPGQNKQEVLNQVLRNQGLSEPQFVAEIERQASMGLLNEALSAGLAAPSPELLNALYLHENETRALELIAFPHAAFELAQPATEADLQTAYEGLKENYAIPETRAITIIALDVSKIADSIDITEEQLRAAYDEDKAAYLVQENRTVEQAIFKSEQEALDAIDLVKAGKSLKAATEKVAGDAKPYRGESDFDKAATLAEIRSVAFDTDAKTGEALGPVKSALGWHVMIVKAIKPHHLKPFETVRKDILQDQMEVQLMEQTYALSNTLDDLLASGASLDEIKNELEIKVTEVKDLTSTGLSSAGNQVLSAYGENAALIAAEAFGLEEGESSQVIELTDGSFAAVRVDSITPKSYKEFAKVKGALRETWTANEKAAQNRKHVLTLLNGDANLSAISSAEGKPIKSIKDLKRAGDLPAPLIGATKAQIFGADLNKLFLIDIEDGVAIAQVTSARLPDAPQNSALADLKARVQGQEETEALTLFLEDKRAEYGVSVNETLLRQVYGSGGTF